MIHTLPSQLTKVQDSPYCSPAFMLSCIVSGNLRPYETHQGKYKHQSLCSKDTCYSQYLFPGSWWQLQGPARPRGSIFPYVGPPKIVLPTLSFLAAIKWKGHLCYEHNVHTQGLFHSLFECSWVMGMMSTNYSL